MENLRRGDCGSSFIKTVLAQHPGLFGNLLANASRFRFQLLLSIPVAAPDGSLRLVRHGYRVEDEYFYPASAIKMCAAVAAIQKLERLQSLLGISVNCISPVALYSLFEGIEDDRSDPSNINQKQITVAHEIRKIFLVSDNQAFNRLFSFVGHRTINQAIMTFCDLLEKPKFNFTPFTFIQWVLDQVDIGNVHCHSTRLHHRLSVTKTVAENLYSEPIDINVAGTAVTLPPKHSGLIVQDNSGLPGIKVGTAFIEDDDHLVPRPMDFSMKNYMSMVDQQDLLIKLVRPDIEVGTPGLKLDTSMRMLLMEAMSQYPSRSANPKYDGSDYPDDFCKFFLPGLSRIRPKGALRIYNKIGRAYGFTVDNSYVFDVETGRSFFLTAVIYTNANGVLNDDRYEYEFADCTLADLAEVLGRALWQIPDGSANSSGPFDCTPSSVWTICIKPLTIPTFIESRPDAEEVEDSKLPAKDSINAVEQHLTEPMLTSSAENRSLDQPHIQKVSHQACSNFVEPEKESSSGSIMMWSSSNCSSALHQSLFKSAQIDTTSLPTTGGQHCNPLGHGLPMPFAQVSSVEDASTPPFVKISENSLKPCYKYFVDE